MSVRTPSDAVSQRVRDWYAVARDGTDLGSKVIDWQVLMAVGLSIVQDRDVLNLGPERPVDEFVLGALARSWTAIDFSESVITRCCAYVFPRQPRYLVMDIRELGFAEGSFDVVLDFSSSDHLHDADRPRHRLEVYRVLRPRGYYVVTYPNACQFEGHQRERDDCFGYERHFTPDELAHEVVVAGFEVLYHRRDTMRSGLVARRCW